MKKNNFNKIFTASLLVMLLGIASCDKDDATGDSTFQVVDGVVGSVTTDFDNSSTITVNEGDEDVFTYTISLNKPSTVDIEFRVIQTGGDAVRGEDFEMDEFIKIPAYSTSATGSISILSDILVEDTKTLSLQIGDVSLANATMQFVPVNFVIENYESTEMDFSLTFGKEFYYQGEMMSTCSIGYDMDYYVLDSSFGDTGIYDAATGACPTESLSVSVDPTHPNYLPDGIYYIYYDIYDDGGISGVYHDVFTVPTSVEFYRAGLLNPVSFEQEAAYVPDSTFGSGSDYVLTIEINSGVISVLDSSNTILGAGRIASNKDKIQASIQKARASRLTRL